MKFYIQNYRLDTIPQKLKAALDSGYTHYWGNLYLYGPTISGPVDRFEIKFSGRYVVQSASASAHIDGRSASSGDTLSLERGWHAIQTSSALRLELVPTALGTKLDPALKDSRDFFPNVYEF